MVGTTIFMTRRGLLPKITRARKATDGDVTPQRVSYEQWEATLQRFQGGIDTSLTENAHAIASVLGSDVHALGLQAAMSINSPMAKANAAATIAELQKSSVDDDANTICASGH